MSAVKNVFDRVEIDESGHVRVLTKDQFIEIPITERVGLLLAGKIRFFLDQTEVSNSEALNSLKRLV
jgi:hypothetical protein